VVNDVKNHMAY